MNEEQPFAENADLIRALEDAPPRGDIVMPERVLFQLERARREALGDSVQPTVKRAAPTFLQRHSTLLLRAVAALALLGAAAVLLFPSATPTAEVTMLSPVGESADQRPFIAWDARDKPGQKYDVWILPADGDHLTAATLFKAEKVTSPVSFSDLKAAPGVASDALHPDTEYRVLVCLADMGRTAGVPFKFKVKPGANR
jgi:hypothetical protein